MTTLVIATLAKVRAPHLLPSFLSLSQRCVHDALVTDGNLGAQIRARGPLTWCTLTGWADTESAGRFVGGAAHIDAMRLAERLLRGTAFARFNTDGPIDRTLWPQAFEALGLRVP